MGSESGVPASIFSETAAVVSGIHVESGELIASGQLLMTTELMKMRQEIRAPSAGTVFEIFVSEGAVIEAGTALLTFIRSATTTEQPGPARRTEAPGGRAALADLRTRRAMVEDAARPDAVARRDQAGMRTARENVADLVDAGSFLEYGALALAAQRRKYRPDELIAKSPADGVITGIGTVGGRDGSEPGGPCAVIAVDYTVMAGTQGFFHHKKIDRLLDVVHERPMPVVVFAEGGGGRPNDIDTADITFSGLDVPTFYRFAQLAGKVPRITIVAGRCFAGNAAFAGTADLVIATRGSNLGMGGPAMIEGGGLGVFRPDEIGPAETHFQNGVIDLLVEDEAEAVALTKSALGYFQGARGDGTAPDGDALRDIVPEDRQLAYDIRDVVAGLADEGSVLELKRGWGVGMVTALIRIAGKAFGLIANNPLHLGGAIDGDAADKAADFLAFCERFGFPVVSLCDTPGLMVGPDAERAGQVRRAGRLFLAGAALTVPLFTIVLRKGYGLGAQAMAGGSFHRPMFTASWPTGEFGAMGLEGAVRLGARAELAAIEDDAKRERVFRSLVNRAYQRGKAINAASLCEFDAVIDPADTRTWILTALAATGHVRRPADP